MLTAICPAPPHRQAPLRIYGGYAEMLCPDIGDRKVPRREEQAVADLSSLQSVSPVAHPAWPRHGEKRKLPSIRPQLDYIGLRSQSQEQLVSNMAGRAVPLWQDDMAFGAELTQRPKRSACACSAQVQEFDRMHSTHSKEYGLAIGPLNIPRGTARPEAAAEISSGIKSLVSSHVPSQQSPYFLGSQQQPLFLTTFDMPLEAPPPPGLRPFYGHPWPWCACPQPQGNGLSTGCSSPQHGDTGPWGSSY
ncbi:hypothetical protein WJX77_003408 [Trebouxia sp. C0004]